MDDKKSIRELLEYYIEKYSLLPKSDPDDSMEFQEMYGKYFAQIRRILKSTHIGEKPLWDDIKPEKGSRKISINDFEISCFDSWSAYLKKQDKDEYGHILLEKDIEQHKIRLDECYLAKKLKTDKDEHNRMIEYGLSEINADEMGLPFVTDREISQKGHEMMLEAIYDIFYESFNWEQLTFDLKNSIILDNGYNPKVTISNQKSIESLKDYSNYVGRKKLPYSKIPQKEET